MFFLIKKYRWQILLSLFTLLVFLCSSCERNTQIPNTTNQSSVVTRLDYYKKLYNLILNDESLRSIYYPSTCKYDAASFFLDNNLYDLNSFRDLIYSTKAAALSKFSIEEQSFKNNIFEKQVFLLSYNTNDTSASVWNNIFSDYNDISEKDRSIIDFFCKKGLILFDFVQSQKYLNINKKISQEEIKWLHNIIKSKSLPLPINSVEANDINGNIIHLSLDDPISLEIIKDLISRLTNCNEIINSFIYFNDAGNALSLWINSRSCGVFSIPLLIKANTQLQLPCCLDNISILQRLNIAKSFIPKSHLDDFHDFCNKINTEDTQNYIFECQYNNLKVTISITATDASAGLVLIDIL